MANNGIDLLPPDDPEDFAIWALALGMGLYLIYKFTGGQNPPPGPQKTVSLTVKSVGPGKVTVIISGKSKGNVRGGEKSFGEINYGASISLDPKPDKNATLESIDGKESFSIRSDTTITAKFVGSGEYPYGLTAEQWGVCTDSVQTLLEDHIPYSEWLVGKRDVTFGFKGWFNDRRLAWGNMDPAEYARKVANIISLGSPGVIIDVHYAHGTPAWAKEVNYSQLLDYTKRKG